MLPIDTTPNYPAQPKLNVENAARDLPSVLQEMANESNFGATDPGHGQRIVLAKNLVEELSRRGHSGAAAAWAIHQLVDLGCLMPEIGATVEYPIIGHRPDENSTVVQARRFFGSHADSPRYQIPVYGEPVKKPMAQTNRPPCPLMIAFWSDLILHCGSGGLKKPLVSRKNHQKSTLGSSWNRRAA